MKPLLQRKCIAVGQQMQKQDALYILQAVRSPLILYELEITHSILMTTDLERKAVIHLEELPVYSAKAHL